MIFISNAEDYIKFGLMLWNRVSTMEQNSFEFALMSYPHINRSMVLDLVWEWGVWIILFVR